MQEKLHSTRIVKDKKTLSVTQGICPFNEEPAVDRFRGNSELALNKSDMDADVLFSLFTADIINEKIVFKR